MSNDTVTEKYMQRKRAREIPKFCTNREKDTQESVPT